LNAATDQTVVDARLGPLAFNSGAFLMQTDCIWGVLGIIAGVLAEIAINGKLARARASRTRGRK
jgi:hypothetical protein